MRGYPFLFATPDVAVWSTYGAQASKSYVVFYGVLLGDNERSAHVRVQGSVLASDAFFPFSWNDSVEKACQAGVAAIAHPGGSLRDQDAIDCCNKYGVALVTTSVRHFRH